MPPTFHYLWGCWKTNREIEQCLRESFPPAFGYFVFMQMGNFIAPQGRKVQFWPLIKVLKNTEALFFKLGRWGGVGWGGGG